MSSRCLQRVSLLALVAAAFVVAPLTARATAGVRIDEVECCCPDPAACACHDHEDDGPDPEPRVRKCGQDGEIVWPVVAVAVLPPPSPRPHAPRAATAPPLRRGAMPEDRPTRPVTPPF